MQITASDRWGEPGVPQPPSAAAEFRTHSQGLAARVAWLRGHGVTAATMESTGVYWYAPFQGFQGLQGAGIRAELVHAQHVKQIRGRKTDVQDSRWLARSGQFDLARPSYALPAAFGALRQQCRYRRKVVGDRARRRQRLQKTLNHDGLRQGADRHPLRPRAADSGRLAPRGLAGAHLGGPHAARASQARRPTTGLGPAARPHALERRDHQLADFDAATAWLEDLDARTEAALAPHEK